MNDDAIYDLVRSTLTDLAAEARPVDLLPETQRRMRRRAVSVSIGAVCAVATLVIGVPVAVAAGADGGPGRSTPSVSFARSAPAPTGRPAVPALSKPARFAGTGTSPAAIPTRSR